MNFLSSFLPSIPDLSLSKRAVKFVLQQAFGTFLSTDIDLDQLSLDLGTGKVELKSAELNVDSLNELFLGSPWRLAQGSLGSVRVQVPWKDLLTGLCELDIATIDVTIKLLDLQIEGDSWAEPADSRLQASVDDMTASFHMAQELLQNAHKRHLDTEFVSSSYNAQGSSTSELGSVETLARTIEDLANRFRVTAQKINVMLSLDSEPDRGILLSLSDLCIEDDCDSIETRPGESKPSDAVHKRLSISRLDLHSNESRIPTSSQTWLATMEAFLLQVSLVNGEIDSQSKVECAVNVNVSANELRSVIDIDSHGFLQLILDRIGSSFKKLNIPKEASPIRPTELQAKPVSSQNMPKNLTTLPGSFDSPPPSIPVNPTRTFSFLLHFNINQIVMFYVSSRIQWVTDDRTEAIVMERLEAFDRFTFRIDGLIAAVSPGGREVNFDIKSFCFAVQSSGSQDSKTMLSYTSKEKEHLSPFFKVTLLDSKRTMFFKHPMSGRLDPFILQACLKLATAVTKPGPEIRVEERVSKEVLVCIPDFNLVVTGSTAGSPVIRVATSELTISAIDRVLNVSCRHLSVFVKDGEESQTFLVVTSDGGQLPTFRTLTRADSICATSQQSPAQSTKSSSDSEQEWQNISVRDDKKPNPSLEAEHADERRNPQSLPAGTGMRTQHDSKWRFEIPKVQAHVTEVILTSLERTFTDLFPAAADTNGSHEPGRRASYLEIFIATGEISLDDRGDRALLKASQIMIHHSVQEDKHISASFQHLFFAYNDQVMIRQSDLAEMNTLQFTESYDVDLLLCERTIMLDTYGTLIPIQEWLASSVHLPFSNRKSAQPTSDALYNSCAKITIQFHDLKVSAGDMLPGNFSLKTVKIQGNVIDDSPEINFIVRLDELKIQPTFQRTIINVMTWDFGELAVRVDRASSRFSVDVSGKEAFVNLDPETYVEIRRHLHRLLKRPMVEISNSPKTSVYQQTEVEAISRALEETVFASHNAETKARSESLSSWQDVQIHDDFYDISEDFVSSEGVTQGKRVMKEEAIRRHANCTWNPDFGHFGPRTQRLAIRPLVKGIWTITAHNCNLTVRLLRQSPWSRSSSASSTEDFFDAPLSVPELSMELKFTHCNVGLELFEKSLLSSRLRVTVKEFQVLDHIESSTWTKFMSSAVPSSNQLPRETDRDMVKMEINVRENEHALRVAIFPFRLQIDQDTLDFIYEFFSKTGGEVEEKGDNGPDEAPDETFFSTVEISPITFHIDYSPKSVDFKGLSAGKYVELLHVFALDDVELRLEPVRLSAIKGWRKLGDTLVSKWLPRVYETQLPSVASGIAGVRSLVNLGSGVADLILLPLDEYNKRDKGGSVSRGIQKGAKSFLKNATMESLKLGSKLADGTQVLLEQAEELLLGHSSSGFGSLGESGSSNLRQTIIAVSMGRSQQTLKAVPVAILRPLIGSVKRAGQALRAMENEG